MNPAAGVYLWVDLAAPSIPESLILSDTFHFHPLSVDDAMSSLQYQKIEAYDVKMAMLVSLVFPIVILTLTGISSVKAFGTSSISNPGPLSTASSA